jgi:hypothetical protein
LKRAVLVGVLTFLFVWIGQSPPGFFTDFDYFWLAGHAVWQGLDPYAVTRQAIEHGTHRVPFYYPGTAALLMLPFGAVSRHLGIALFTALGMSLLALSVTGWRCWIVLSAPALQAIMLGQWSPWTTAAIGLPWLGFMWAGKPSVGLALFLGWPSRQALAGGLAVIALAFVALPHWPSDWLAAIGATVQYTAPVQRFGGALLLLAFIRWRQPEARMLGLLALVPHTTGIYEQLPLLLIPQTKRRFAVLMGLSWLAAVLVYTLVSYNPELDVVARVQRGLTKQWPYFLVLVWLPALWMVLTDRASSPESHATKAADSNEN